MPGVSLPRRPCLACIAGDTSYRSCRRPKNRALSPSNITPGRETGAALDPASVRRQLAAIAAPPLSVLCAAVLPPRHRRRGFFLDGLSIEARRDRSRIVARRKRRHSTAVPCVGWLVGERGGDRMVYIVYIVLVNESYSAIWPSQPKKKHARELALVSPLALLVVNTCNGLGGR